MSVFEINQLGRDDERCNHLRVVAVENGTPYGDRQCLDCGKSLPPGPPNPPCVDMSPAAIRARNADAAAYRAEHSPEGVRVLRRRNQELTAMVEELVWAMHLWAEYENGLHPDAEASFWAGVAEVNARVESRPGPDGNLRHRFTDLDWVQRQRDRWRERQGE